MGKTKGQGDNLPPRGRIILKSEDLGFPQQEGAGWWPTPLTQAEVPQATWTEQRIVSLVLDCPVVVCLRSPRCRIRGVECLFLGERVALGLPFPPEMRVCRQVGVAVPTDKQNTHARQDETKKAAVREETEVLLLNAKIHGPANRNAGMILLPTGTKHSKTSWATI